ncbi:hypothetical protein [Robinsoniella peoriensis]|uniref:hypothetical protein n=1 Tax=Robinsoniella peoriensis TaxID=180332 RepID=UPI00085BD4F5|nr:hypothetical protein [Robinsoniella peoriensis]
MLIVLINIAISIIVSTIVSKIMAEHYLNIMIDHEKELCDEMLETAEESMRLLVDEVLDKLGRRA